MSHVNQGTPIDKLESMFREQAKSNPSCNEILEWLEEHKIKTFEKLKEILDSGDSEKLQKLNDRQQRRLRQAVMQIMPKSSRTQGDVPLYSFNYVEQMAGIEWFDPAIARQADIEHLGGVIYFQNPISDRSNKLLSSLENESIAAVKRALAQKTSDGIRNGIYDLLRGQRIKPASIDGDLVPNLDFFDAVVLEKIFEGELSRTTPSLETRLEAKKDKIRPHFRAIIEYLISINEPGLPNIWGLSTDEHVKKLMFLATNQNLTPAQVQRKERLLEELAMFLTEKQAGDLFAECKVPVLTGNEEGKKGVELITQYPLDKFGGHERERRAAVRRRIYKR